MINLAIFGGTSNPELVNSICDSIGVQIKNAKVTRFPDGETTVKVYDDVRGNDCFVIQPTCPPVNESIMELLIYIDCLKRASAKSITAVIPYFGYARQDRKAEGRTPITARMVADLISQSGVDRVLTIDLHAKQIEGFFDVPVDHLTARPVFVRNFVTYDLDNTVILSPDVGNMKVANEYAQELGVDIAVIDKRRINGEEVESSTIVGNVAGKDVLMFDDMISTAGTICAASRLAKEKGCRRVSVAASHGLFVGRAIKKLLDSDIDNVIVTDTIPLNKAMKEMILSKNEKFPKIKIISIAKLVGEAIIRIYDKRSVSVLLESDYDYKV
jgi:ribose-phosphate pyrophosphokinase